MERGRRGSHNVRGGENKGREEERRDGIRRDIRSIQKLSL